jgi:Proprotein convertase P-domain
MKTKPSYALSFGIFALTAAVASVAACGVSPGSDDAVARDALGATDTQDPFLNGELAIGETSSASLSRSARVHAFDFYVPARGEVSVYTLPALPDSAEVDTVLSLYKREANGFGSAIASSDDARRTAWSSIARTLEPGTYRVLVRGKTSRTRGAFRIGLDCPTCLETTKCVFGTTFRRVREGLTVKVERARVVSDVSQLSALEGEQLVDALHASTHTDVTTPEEALAAADQHEVNILRVWDTSNARAFVAFEYGAGDNSYGRIYPLTSAIAVASIQDGDLENCTVLPGRGGRDCRSNTECGGEFPCTGISPASGTGKCAPTASTLEGIGNGCTSAPANSCNAGLVCGGLTRSDQGSCVPTWMQGTFSDWYGVAIPDPGAKPSPPGQPSGISRYIDVYGLATVDVDVELNAIVRHGDTAQLRVTLTNPAGTEISVFDGASPGTDLHLARRVLGFSGDESVNGRWILKVVDTKRGTTGSLERWSLRITSRFD